MGKAHDIYETELKDAYGIYTKEISAAGHKLELAVSVAVSKFESRLK